MGKRCIGLVILFTVGLGFEVWRVDAQPFTPLTNSEPLRLQHTTGSPVNPIALF